MQLTAKDADEFVAWMRDRCFGRECCVCGRRFKPRTREQRFCSLECSADGTIPAPTPEEIEARAAEVRARWSARTEQDRRVACYKTRRWAPPELTVTLDHRTHDAT